MEFHHSATYIHQIEQSFDVVNDVIVLSATICSINRDVCVLRVQNLLPFEPPTKVDLPTMSCHPFGISCTPWNVSGNDGVHGCTKKKRITYGA